MPALINAQTGQPEQLSDEQAQAALVDQTHGFAPGQKVSVVSADGQRFDVSPENVGKAFALGARLEGDAEAHRRIGQAEYGEGIGNEIKAGLAGAARGATFGLSDVALTRTGLVNPETLAGLKEFNPLSSTAGEIAGAVAPALLSGGSSALASGAEVAGSGVRAVSALGGAAERGVASLLAGGAEAGAKGLARRVFESAVSKGVGSAVEGAFYGAGQLVSEEALGDPQLNAEKVLAHIGLSAALGGATGGAFGAGGQLAEASLGAVKSGVEAANTKVRDMFAGIANGGKSADAVRKQISEMADISSTLTGTSKQEIEFFANPENINDLKLAMSGDETIMKSATDIAKKENEFDALFDEINDQGRGANKLKGLVPKVKDTDTQVALKQSGDVIQQIEDQLGVMSANKDSYGQQALLSKARSSLERTKDAITGSSETGAEANARLFYELDNFKRDLQKLTNKASKVRGMGSDVATFEGLTDLQQSLRSHLEDQSLWGEAGAAQADVNEAWTRFLGNERYAGADFHKLRRSQSFEDVYENDPTKWMGFFKRQGTPAAAMDSSYLAERLSTRNNLVEAMQRNFATDAAAAKKVARLKELSDEIAGITKETERVSTLQNRFKAIEGDGSISGMAAGALAGLSTSGLRGAVKGALAAKALSQPQQTLRQLASAQGLGERVGGLSAVERASQAVTKKITDSIDALINKSSRAAVRDKAVPAATSILGKIKFGDRHASAEPDEKKDDFDNRAAELARLAADPTKLTQTLSRSFAGITKAAPKTASAAMTTAINAAAFLHAKAPKPPLYMDTAVPTKNSWQASKVEKAKWARYVRAVDDPMSVLDDMHDGTIAPEGMEALKAIYPGLHREIVAAVSDRYGKLTKDLPYQRRLALSAIIDAPLDETMRPDFVRAMQASYAQSPEPDDSQPGGAVNMTVGGMSKLRVSGREQLSSERVLSRAG